MPLTSRQKKQLFAALRRAGWRDRDDALWAPHGTFWLAAEPTIDDLEDLRYRMLGRLDRIRTNYSSQSEQEREHAMSDLRSLIQVLDEIGDDKGTDTFRTHSLGSLTATPLQR